MGDATDGVGFGTAFVGDGTGGGASSGLTVREGLGNVGALRLLFAFPFEFSLLLAFALPLLFSSGEGWNSAFTLVLAFALVFTLVAGFIVPPEGMPCSFFPVAGDAAIAG